MTLKRPTQINAQIYDRFLREVAKRYKGKEGSKKLALEQAIKLWIKTKPNKSPEP